MNIFLFLTSLRSQLIKYDHKYNINLKSLIVLLELLVHINMISINTHFS